MRELIVSVWDFIIFFLLGVIKVANKTTHKQINVRTCVFFFDQVSPPKQSNENHHLVLSRVQIIFGRYARCLSRNEKLFREVTATRWCRMLF